MLESWTSNGDLAWDDSWDIYTVDDVYQLALKLEEGLKFGASKHPSSQIGSIFSNQTMSKLLSLTNFQTSNHVHVGGSNQHASNVPNRDANEGKTSISIGNKNVGMTSLGFKCGGHGHYVVLCLSKGLYFCVEEPESKLENYSKEEETQN